MLKLSSDVFTSDATLREAQQAARQKVEAAARAREAIEVLASEHDAIVRTAQRQWARADLPNFLSPHAPKVDGWMRHSRQRGSGGLAAEKYTGGGYAVDAGAWAAPWAVGGTAEARPPLFASHRAMPQAASSQAAASPSRVASQALLASHAPLNALRHRLPKRR